MKPSKPNFVHDAWDDFRAKLIPDAPQIQITEMRRAFFAGAATVFFGLMTLLEEGDDATEADLSQMDMLAEELQGFASKVGIGDW